MLKFIKRLPLLNRKIYKMEGTSHQPFSEFTYKSRVTESLKVLPGDTLKALEDARTIAPKVIGTHSEVFHCDEVLGSTLLLYTKDYANSVILRTRNQEVLDQIDIVIDVGAVFDASKNRFDHHQRSFNMTWSDEENQPLPDPAGGEQPIRIKLSSAGLVYKYFGKEILTSIMNDVWPEIAKALNENDLEKIYQKLYRNFIQEIDAKDNGVSVAKEERYWINTALGTRVSRFNKAWNAPAEVDQNLQFKRAMKIVEEELYWQIYSIVAVYMPARKLVEDAWNKREAFHASGEFIFMENSCPWKDHLYNIELEQDKEGLIKFVFFTDGRGMHRVQGVAPKGSGYDQRVPLCKAWRGLRAEELKKITEFPDIEFVHHSGFIGGAWSLKSVLKMAELSIQEHAEEQKNQEPKE